MFKFSILESDEYKLTIRMMVNFLYLPVTQFPSLNEAKARLMSLCYDYLDTKIKKIIIAINEE